VEKLSPSVKRPLWVAGLNIALALTIGSTRAFASTDINSVADLLAVSGETNYVLRVSLDLANDDASSAEGEQRADVETLGDPSYIGNGFTGTFDGGGFTISGLTKPLFDGINEGVITNLDLEADQVVGVMGKGILANQSWATINNVNVTGGVFGGVDSNGVGGLVGYSGGNISGSSATGDVTGTYNVGGLVGTSYGSISGSFAESDVNGDITVGGLVGDSNRAILNSSASGNVSGNFYVGGLVGNSTSSISESFAEGDVLNASAEIVGGLVGYSSGTITNSYATGAVSGSRQVGGLMGTGPGAITNSYAAGDVTGGVTDVGGLVGYQLDDIANSYASGNVTGDSVVGGLVGTNWGAAGAITRSYAAGNVIGYQVVGGLVGDNYVPIDDLSYGAGEVTGTGGGYIQPSSGLPPLSATELLAILNTGLSPIFALNPSINLGRPFLISNNPFAEEEESEEEESDEQLKVSLRIGFNFLPTQALDALTKSVGFVAAKSDLNKLELAFLDQVKGEKSAPITGAKLFANQSLTTSLSVGSLLQLEITFQADKSLQMWVKSSDGQYVLVGDVTFDKDGNAVLPGIEFKKSGSYEFIFVTSEKKGLTQPEIENKVSGLTVYVNQ